MSHVRLQAGLAGLALAALVAAACGPISPMPLPAAAPQRAGDAQGSASAALQVANPGTEATQQEASKPAPTPTVARQLTRATAAVRRGPITDQLLLTGRVAGVDEAALSFPAAGRVSAVNVKAGQDVQAGDVLVETDSTALARDIASLSNKIDLSSLRLDVMRAQAEIQQQSQRANAEIRRQNAVADAQEQIRRAEADIQDAQDRVRTAEADFQKVQAGPSATDHRAADAAIVTAQAALDRANADLARLQAGPTADQLRPAEQRVRTAQLALRRAQSEQAALEKGTDPTELKAAELALANAKAALGDAKAQLDAAKNVDKPSSAAVDAAKARVDAAEVGVAVAQGKLDALKKGADPAALDLARATVASALADLDDAEAALRDLKAPAPADQVQAAKMAVDAARIALENAQAHRDELVSHPTDDELAAAQQRVDNARANLDRAQARLAAAQTSLTMAQSGQVAPTDVGTSGSAAAGAAGATDPVTLQREIELDRAQLASMQRDLEATCLRAPSDGSVVALQVQAGDQVDARKIVLVLAPTGEPVVSAVVNALDPSAPAVQAGQNATVQLDGSGAILNAQVADLRDGPTGTTRVAQLKVDWAGTRPLYGATAQVRVKVQEKTDALLVPAGVVRMDGNGGNGGYVEYLDGQMLRSARVQVGIADGTNVEILSGLQPGQVVVLGS